MKGEKYYSVRMRASQNGSHEEGGKHISGGERLTTYSGLKQAINALLAKSLGHSRGQPDFMQIQFEAINQPIKLLHPLQVNTNQVNSVETGKELAVELLKYAGVPSVALEKAYQQMPEYSEVRGAVFIDIHSGKRIDGRKEKGVRVSRIDWSDTNFRTWATKHDIPLKSRIKEALALATKVCDHPAVIAEFCFSDDPDYITGYVASKNLGYQRVTKLKECGDENGCRIFFVDSSRDLENCINDLEKQPVMIYWGDQDAN
ncbi:6-carboxyhexanoate--CoA ligase [Bacillus changyiensis]|uniref:6-carboxyhexanoate--CoA ligase n=1 Tax=Bacillus changyiensis TaxID=3004103 RepID=UPI0022E8AFA4|nr:6-carboxyhexanoate--CoA ligase [Bacillus changyiensis]MDA1477164.1 6-carboxyhexanoate--CoA ligase [Bacillus changyiensis]